jgi:hypothetical protein
MHTIYLNFTILSLMRISSIAFRVLSCVEEDTWAEWGSKAFTPLRALTFLWTYRSRPSQSLATDEVDLSGSSLACLPLVTAY